jgi:hypothetical protein
MGESEQLRKGATKYEKMDEWWDGWSPRAGMFREKVGHVIFGRLNGAASERRASLSRFRSGFEVPEPQAVLCYLCSCLRRPCPKDSEDQT